MKRHQFLAGLQRQQHLWESTHSGNAFSRGTEGAVRAGQGQGSRSCSPSSCATAHTRSAGDVTCPAPETSPSPQQEQDVIKMNCTREQDHVCHYHGLALGVPGCSPSSGSSSHGH